MDTALPFGLRSAPKIFTAVADAVEWIAKQEGVGFVIHYLDDFLVVGPPASGGCEQSLHTLIETFSRLGLPVAEEKLEGPTTVHRLSGIHRRLRVSHNSTPTGEAERTHQAAEAVARVQSLHSKGTGVSYGKVGTRGQVGSPRENVHGPDVPAVGRGLPSAPSGLPEPIVSLRY